MYPQQDYITDFNPRSREGATHNFSVSLHTFFISIHAPAKERPKPP